MRQAYVLIAHGSRREESNCEFWDLVTRFRKFFRGRYVTGAFLELAQPDIPTALESCVRQGAREIFILPLLLFSGRHVKEDIPHFIQMAKRRHPGIDFHYAGPLVDNPYLTKLLASKALSRCPLGGSLKKRRGTKSSRTKIRKKSPTKKPLRRKKQK